LGLGEKYACHKMNAFHLPPGPKPYEYVHYDDLGLGEVLCRNVKEEEKLLLFEK
jgi:hypothetical protein